MAQLLREIKKARWLRQKDTDPLPATSLRDMWLGEDKRLSLWLMPEENYDEFLRRLVIALTISSKHCNKFEFALVDDEILEELDIRLLDVLGTTHDPIVNAAHRDIEDPGVERLAKLTLKFVPQDVILQGVVRGMISAAVASGELAKDVIPDDILQKLQP